MQETDAIMNGWRYSNAGNRRNHEWLKSCTTLDVIPTLKLWGLQGESIKGATMQYMAGGAGFQPSTVLRQTCSIVSAKPSLTSNSAVVEQNHFHKDYHCVCFSSYIFFCAVSCSCIPVANSSCKFYFHWGKHSQARQSLKPDI